VEIYFNPYPGASKDEQEGIRCIVETADAFTRMKKALQSVPLLGRFADNEVLPSQFVLVRLAGMELGIKDVLYKVATHERIKIQLLLETFSKGRVLDENDLTDIEHWIITNIGVPAPILEIATRNNAIALTIPAEPEWRCDILCFENRSETLYNLWGQKDISNIVKHSIDSLENTEKRFSACFEAVFCDAALNDAPPPINWDNLGFFTTMEKAQKREYRVDDNLIKNVAETKYGPLLELRIYGPGHRIFFAYRKSMSPKVLIGGFYQKNQGSSQDKAIALAQKRINGYPVHGDSHEAKA
jgi:putative component of toxin-antitoxin plasmid stabilization module